jgi:hypothetical protein
MAPNPGSGSVTVEVITVEQGSTLLEVYSTAGARVFSTNWVSEGVISGSGDLREIRLPADLPSGVYRVVLHTPARQDAKSLVITK